MSRTHLLSVAGLAAAFLATGCVMGSARLVHRTQTGGTLALQGHRDTAVEDANNQMAAHCQGPYTVVEEGEHVVGTSTAGGSETYVAQDGTVVEEGGQSTRQDTEWRIRYVCGGGQYAPQPQPAGYPPGQAPAQPAPDPYGQGSPEPDPYGQGSPEPDPYGQPAPPPPSDPYTQPTPQ